MGPIQAVLQFNNVTKLGVKGFGGRTTEPQIYGSTEQQNRRTIDKKLAKREKILQHICEPPAYARPMPSIAQINPTKQ